MTGIAVLASEGDTWSPPSLAEFFPPAIFFEGTPFQIDRINLIGFFMTGVVALFFVLAFRNPQIVPGRLQNMGEVSVDFVRTFIADEILGSEGRKYGPYLATLFFMILAFNISGITPLPSAGPDVAAQHLVAANVTEEAFWQWQEEQGREPDEGVEDYSNWNEFETSDKESQKPEKKKSGVKKGAKMMGIGLLMFGAGAGLAVAGAAPGVVLGTIGAIFFLIGLIRLLVAAISGSEPDSDGEEKK